MAGLKNKEIKKFIYGAQYYRAPTPLPEEWDIDIRTIKKIGLNAIQLRPQWRWHEKIRGKFCWDDIDRLFDLAEKKNLYVIFKFMLETAPAWLYRMYGCERVGLNGQKILPGAHAAFYVGGWLPCFDHPKVREEANRFIEVSVKRYKERSNLLAWNVWNEPRSRPYHECCCEESKRKYRIWLKERFGSIEKLNTFLGKAWGSFDEIDPPPMFEDYAEMYLWRQWAMYSVSDRVRWVYEQVKKNDANHSIYAHVGGCSVIQDVVGDTSNDWLNAQQVDFYGSSLPVEAIPTKPHHRAAVGLHCDWLRSISPYFWINEFYPDTDRWMQEIKVEDLRSRIWSTIAHGAKGIIFWQYRAERLGCESNGQGLVGINGEINQRTKEVERISKVINKYENIFRTFEVSPSDVAILYDHRSDLVSRIENTKYDTPLTTVDYTYKLSLHGSYTLFWHNHIPVDWLSSQEMEELNRYKLIYLPAPYVVDKSMAEKLTQFVKKGGCLVSESSIGLRAENTWVSLSNPGFGLEHVFGCKEERRLVINEPRTFSTDRYGMKVPVTRMMTWLSPDGAEILGSWEDGGPALTSHNYGKGKAILIGMYPGASYIDTFDRRLIQFINRIIQEADVNDFVKMQGVKGTVHSRILAKGNQKIVFLFNYSNEAEKFVIREPRLTQVVDLCEVAEVKERKEGLEINLPTREVAVILGKVVS